MKNDRIRLFTVPNFITLAGLACGSTAIVYALYYNSPQIVFYLVIAAAVFDFLDGFAARALGAYSEVGKQLDSLSDMVSFGLAPAAVLFAVYNELNTADLMHPALGFLVFLIPLFSALRLAKFNVDDRQKTEFIGMPTPAAAMLVTSLAWLHAAGIFLLSRPLILATALVVSLLLISPIRMFSLKFSGFGLSGNKLRYLFLLASLALIVFFRVASIPMIIILYVLMSLIRNVACQKA